MWMRVSVAVVLLAVLVAVTDLNLQPCVVHSSSTCTVGTYTPMAVQLGDAHNISHQNTILAQAVAQLKADTITLQDHIKQLQQQVMAAQIGALEARDAIRGAIARLPKSDIPQPQSHWSKAAAQYAAISWILFVLLSPKKSKIEIVCMSLVWTAAAFGAVALQSSTGATLCAGNALLQLIKLLFV